MVKYDIIFVDYPYKDGGSGPHPAVVLEGNKIAHLIAEISSQVKNKIGEHDYLIKAWRDAGLEKENIIRLDQQASITEDDIIKYIGKLKSADIRNIEAILNPKESRK